LKVLRLVPLALILAACSSIKVPSLSPYRIDVQQGNALEQESVEKLKPGLSRSQVRFLLGTPLLVDPFHTNRWDYVYNYRKAGKLSEERRLVLFFDGDVLARIEAEGFPPKETAPEAKPAVVDRSAEKPAEQVKPAVVESAPAVAPSPAESARPAQPAPVAAVEAPSKPAPAVQSQAKPVVEPAPAAAQALPAKAASSSERSLNETSIVPPLRSEQAPSAPAPLKTASIGETSPEPVVLQPEANVAAIKPDVMPEFPKTSTSAPSSPEEQVTAALDAWANAWRSRDEEAYLAAYAANFRPEGGESRAEWEKRRRLLLGLARNVDLKIDGVATEIVTEDRAQVSFRQFYRSDSYQDAVIKQVKFVRVDNLWLIEEEKVLAPIRVKK
jgi:outer membrane protein assembly factor BamE